MTRKRTPEQLARHAAYERKYRAANPEKYRKRAAQKREKFGEDIAAKWRQRYNSDTAFRKRVAARAVVWNATNSKRRRQIVKKYGDSNRGQLNQKGRAWKAKNRDKCKTHKHARRARERAAEGSHTAAEWCAILAAHGNRCIWCGTKGTDEHPLTRDHYIALSKGGSNFARNIVPSCLPCNNEKKARDPIEFAQSRGMLL